MARRRALPGDRGRHGRVRQLHDAVGLCAQSPDAGLDLRDRGARAHHRARLCGPDQSGAGSVLQPRGLQRRARHYDLRPPVPAGTGRRRGACVHCRWCARPHLLAARRTLFGDGDHQLSNHAVTYPDELGRAYPRPRRRAQHQAPDAVRRLFPRQRPLSGDVHRGALWGRSPGLAPAQNETRTCHAGGARQRARRRRHRRRHLSHQGRRLHALGATWRLRRRAVRRRLLVYQPGPVQLQRVDRVPHHGADRRLALAGRHRARHRPADPAAGVAAFPQERLSRGLWRRRHPDHGVHAGRHLGFCHRALAQAQSDDADCSGRDRAAPAHPRGRPAPTAR